MSRMRRPSFFSLILLPGLLAFPGCVSHDGMPEGSSTTTPAEKRKIPVTTSSEDARREFLQGRDKAERLLGPDSVPHFDRAISLDPGFALAELGRANVSTSPKEFFEHLNRAVNLAAGVTEGERLLILGSEAAANGDSAKQKEFFAKLVISYPGDERAHSNLGNYFFGQQDYARALEHYRRAAELAPDYSIAYNMMGYAYRQSGRYAEAERAFLKYIQLIPNDPNPYDSYAELLLKTGHYRESIEQYRKALSIDPDFVASRMGMAANLLYLGNLGEAEAELQKVAENARNDGERRAALFGRAVLAADAGRLNIALQEIDALFALAEKSGDAAAMAGDLQARGDVLVEMNNAAEAKQAFDRALEIIEGSALSTEIKANARRLHHYNLARVALKQEDLPAASVSAVTFRKGAEQKRDISLIRQTHELFGMIALEEENYDAAVSELGQASLEDPYNLYRLGVACDGKGETGKAAEYFEKAAGFNPLLSLNHAFIRKKAGKLPGAVKSSRSVSVNAGAKKSP